MGKINPGIINNYTVKPKNLTQYTAYRGVTDFTQIGQFNQYETGYSFLSVLGMPAFIDELAAQDDTVKLMRNSFKHMLEYEFRGLTGLPDIQSQTGEITDGINSLNYINRVNMDTSIQVSSEYFEKSGSLITKFTEYYLTGIKDRQTQAKTYHGLIKNNLMDPGLENEVFTLLYYVTDNTYLRLERAVLLANCQLTEARTSMYDTSRGDISNVPTTITFSAFPIMGVEVDKAAKTLLEEITGTTVNYSSNDVYDPVYKDRTGDPLLGRQDAFGYPGSKTASLDSNDYLYGIMRTPTTANNTKKDGDEGSVLNYAYGNEVLAQAIERAGNGVTKQ